MVPSLLVPTRRAWRVPGRASRPRLVGWHPSPECSQWRIGEGAHGARRRRQPRSWPIRVGHDARAARTLCPTAAAPLVADVPPRVALVAGAHTAGRGHHAAAGSGRAGRRGQQPPRDAELAAVVRAIHPTGAWRGLRRRCHRRRCGGCSRARRPTGSARSISSWSTPPARSRHPAPRHRVGLHLAQLTTPCAARCSSAGTSFRHAGTRLRPHRARRSEVADRPPPHRSPTPPPRARSRLDAVLGAELAPHGVTVNASLPASCRGASR